MTFALKVALAGIGIMVTLAVIAFFAIVRRIGHDD